MILRILNLLILLWIYYINKIILIKLILNVNVFTLLDN